MSFPGGLIKKLMQEQDDPYHIGEESDSDEDRGGKSSDEEIDAIEFEQREQPDGSASDDSEDDFEKEMQIDLDSFMSRHSCEASASNTAKTEDPLKLTEKESEQTTAPEGKPDCYDEDYFSSGSEDGDKVGGVASKSIDRRKRVTDEDLFYDPDMDDEDEKWVLKQRERHREKVKALGRKREPGTSSSGDGQSGSATTSKPSKQSKAQLKATKPPSSDAILSCPACMTIVCIDCQRHEVYKNQYRAMFVMNCTVVADETLKYQEQRNFGKKRRKGKQKGKLVPQQCGVKSEGPSSSDRTMCEVEGTTGEVYHPVKCTQCGTEVAVFDKDEIYHFFNILTSYA